MPSLGSFNSAANKNMITGVQLSDMSRKHYGKRSSCLLRAISSFPTMFSKSCVLLMLQNEYLWSKGLNRSIDDHLNI